MELLSTFERSLQPPLPVLINQIEKNLRSVINTNLIAIENVPTIAECFNLCALVEVSFGRPKMARKLCYSANFWISRVISETSSRESLMYLFQPWINLSRIDRIENKRESARYRLKGLLNILKGKAERIGRISISRDDLSLIMQREPNFEGYLWFNWAHQRLLDALEVNSTEMVKSTLAIIGRERVRAFLSFMLIEAEIVINGRSEILESFSLDLPIKLRYVITLRDIEYALLCSHASCEGAVPILQLLADTLISYESTCWGAAMMKKIVFLLERLDHNLARYYGQQGLVLSERVGDEVLNAWFVYSCQRLDPFNCEWEHRHIDIANVSWYRHLRMLNHPNHQDRCQRIDAISNILLDFTN